MWVPAHVGIYNNQVADCIAKAFLYEEPIEIELIIKRSLVCYTLMPKPGSGWKQPSALAADRKLFALTRQLMGEAETARALRGDGDEKATTTEAMADDAEAAATTAMADDAEAAATAAATAANGVEGSSYIGRYPLLDYEKLGEKRPLTDPPRWAGQIKIARKGEGVKAGHERKLTRAGVVGDLTLDHVGEGCEVFRTHP